MEKDLLVQDEKIMESSEEQTEKVIDEEIKKEKASEVIDEEKPLSKKELKRQRRVEKLKKRYLFEQDMKYVGPLSYRYIRAIAWIAIAIGQIILMSNFASKIHVQLLGEPAETILSYASDLATPLFLVATIGIILGNNKSFKSILLMYAISYIGIFLAITIGLRRYAGPIATLFVSVIDGQAMTADQLIGLILSQKINVNVFSDFFILTLFHFFVNYEPKKFFTGKKKKIFRLLTIIPLALLFVSYIAKAAVALSGTVMPFEFYLLLPTKSPLIHLIFIILSIQLKKERKRIMGIGATEEEYKKYLHSNKKSWNFSRNVSILFLIFTIIDWILLGFIIVVFISMAAINGGEDAEMTMALINAFELSSTLGIGDCMLLLIAIPFILLYSYKKQYKNTAIDSIMPFIGIGLVALTYVECIYQIIKIVLKV